MVMGSNGAPDRRRASLIAPQRGYYGSQCHKVGLFGVTSNHVRSGQHRVV
jgi:hypothetical protein